MYEILARRNLNVGVELVTYESGDVVVACGALAVVYECQEFCNHLKSLISNIIP